MDASISYTKIEKTLSILQANLLGTLLMPPILVVFVSPYLLLWGFESFWTGLLSVRGNTLVLILIFISGILLHEWLHGITWKLNGKLPKGSVKYGVKWQFLTPYAHLTMPVPIQTYRLGGLMPGLVLGIIPGIIGVIIGSGWLLSSGIFFSWAAVGDFIMLWLLRNTPPHSLVEDHPDKVGCNILIPITYNEGNDPQ